MLIPLEDLDEANRQKCQTAGWIALDPKTGGYLERSPRHQNRYFLSLPGWARVIIAASDREAIEQANKGLM